MSDELRLDPDTLRNDGARLADLGERVGRTYADLRRGLAAAQGAWGDDDLGEAFAKDFTPHADQLLAGLRAMEESLRGTARQVANAAEDFQTQDLGGARLLAGGGEPSGPGWNYAGGVQPAAPASWQSPENGTVPTGSGFADGAQPPSVPGTVPPASGTSPGASTGPSSPNGRSSPNGPQSPEGPQSQDPSGAPGGRNGPQSGADPSRRPPAAGVSPPTGASPPATGREVPRKPATAGPGPTSSRNRGSAAAARPETPWSGPSSGAPRGATADQNPSSPRSNTPPRPPRAAEDKKDRARETQRPAAEPGTSPLFAWLARTLADRHGVRVVGFDLPGLHEVPVRQFAAAVDRVLSDYPAIELDVVAVAELDDDAEGVRWHSEPGDPATVRSITLDQRVAGDPGTGAETSEAAADSDDQLIYEATVRELGLALNSAGDDAARRAAQRILIVEYMRVAAGRYTTFGELLRGYRDWRAELPGGTGETGFDARRAVAAAFAEVVLRRERAAAPAKALHAALVDAAAG
ncbi:hypothetical protein [Nocardia sp. N2S4-5]|uniref:hypothetical protein n=1 Tax=Nocardia sp. N2S4-5 TaxID=3351565 RepID=UPI0037CFB7F3